MSGQEAAIPGSNDTRPVNLGLPSKGLRTLEPKECPFLRGNAEPAVSSGRDRRWHVTGALVGISWHTQQHTARIRSASRSLCWLMSVSDLLLKSHFSAAACSQ